MKNIQLHAIGYFRFLVFKIDDQYYLFDMRPNHFIGHLFFPLNWLFYHEVYPITLEDYSKIKERYVKLSKFTIPTSLVGGAVVFINGYTRLHDINLLQYFKTDFSLITNIVLLVFSWLIAYGLLQLFYISSKRGLQEIVDSELIQSFNYRLRPEKPFRFFFSLFWAWGFCLIVSVASAIGFLYFKNLAILVMAILFTICYLGSSNGAFSPNEKWQYKIVDIRKSSNK